MSIDPLNDKESSMSAPSAPTESAASLEQVAEMLEALAAATKRRKHWTSQVIGVLEDFGYRQHFSSYTGFLVGDFFVVPFPGKIHVYPADLFSDKHTQPPLKVIR